MCMLSEWVNFCMLVLLSEIGLLLMYMCMIFVLGVLMIVCLILVKL